MLPTLAMRESLPGAILDEAMSQHNVEAVRQAHDAFNERDVERLVALSDPDCVWLPFRAQLEGIEYRGHDGVRRFVADMDEDWTEFRIEPIEFRETGDQVVAIGQVTGQGSGSGVNIDFVGGFVFGMRDGLITHITSYSEPRDALASVGLDE